MSKRLFALALFVSLTLTGSSAWLNETDTAGEADYCVLQYPAFVASTNNVSEPIYGRIFEAGVTEATGASASVTAEVGYGPLGSDPTTDGGWVWFPAAFNTQVGNDDEYVGTLTFGGSGSYSYTFRFSLDAGANHTAADLDGGGSNSGLTFSAAQLGAATINLTSSSLSPTAITYQGELREGGKVAGGAYDFEFTLHDASSGGSLMAGPLTMRRWSSSRGVSQCNWTLDQELSMVASAGWRLG